MKRLGILRHAQAAPSAAGFDDFNRPLTALGKAVAQRLGEQLKSLNLGFDLVLASPARRVRETVDGLCLGLGEVPVRFEQSFCLATEADLRDCLRTQTDGLDSLLMVGHNPAIGQLAIDLADRDDPRLLDLMRGFPTATFALLEFAVDSWAQVVPGRAAIARLILANARS
ncbi:MAG: histidine phosphatase family protein [Sphingomicrobium sp.]